MTSTATTYRSSDPTRTITLRSRFAREFRKRFRALRGLINTAIIDKDVFGIADGNPGLQSMSLVQEDEQVSGGDKGRGGIGNPSLPFSSAIQASQSIPASGAFDFPRTDKKVQEFMEWLDDQVDREILEVTNRRRIGQSIDQTWQNIFIEDSYKRGVQRAAYEMAAAQFSITGIAERGGVQAVISNPFHADRLGVLYTRAFNELKGITDAMDQQISRVLTQGIADGDGPRLIARKLNATISGKGVRGLGIRDSLGRFIPAQRRAEIMARTEVIRAHHQAMYQEYTNWQVEGIQVKAELSTAGDERVCPQCQALEDQGFFKLGAVENLIPVHPQCRCIILPARTEDIPDDVTLHDNPQEIVRAA